MPAHIPLVDQFRPNRENGIHHDKSEASIVFYEFWRPSLVQSAEIKFVRAILYDALVKFRSDKDRAWVADGDIGGFSFNECCAYLGLDASYMRKKVLAEVQFGPRINPATKWRHDNPEKFKIIHDRSRHKRAERKKREVSGFMLGSYR